MNTTVFRSSLYKLTYVPAGAIYKHGQAVIRTKGVLTWKHAVTFRVYDEQEAQVLFSSLMRQPNGHGLEVLKAVWHDRIIQVEL